MSFFQIPQAEIKKFEEKMIKIIQLNQTFNFQFLKIKI